MTIHTSRQSGPAKPLAPVVALDRNAARAAISVAAERFTALLRETDDLECPAAGTDWTCRRDRGPCVLRLHRV